MSYAFPPELGQLVQEQMAVGGYATEEEMLINAIHALSELRSRREQLRSEIRGRISHSGQGLAIPLDLAAFKAEARQRSANGH